MKIFFLSLLLITLSLVGCKKAKNEKEPFVKPSGKWVSVSYYNGNTWVGEAMPHHLAFRTDMSFDFREQSSPLCTGQYSTKYNSNTVTLIKFLTPNCSLTDRFAEMPTIDTLILTVVHPPNITKDKVKYAREP